MLIDYADTDPTVLSLFCRHLGQIHVLKPVLEEEVDSLNTADCDRLGITVVPVDTELLLEAGKRGGALSLHDWASLLVAREMSARCITNDAALRRACEEAGIQCVWGLEIMVELVDAENLPASEALRVAESIHEINPRYISAEILDRFRKRLLEKEP